MDKAAEIQAVAKPSHLCIDAQTMKCFDPMFPQDLVCHVDLRGAIHFELRSCWNDAPFCTLLSGPNLLEIDRQPEPCILRPKAGCPPVARRVRALIVSRVSGVPGIASTGGRGAAGHIALSEGGV